MLSIDDPRGAGTLGDNADQIWLWDTTAMNWKRYFYRSARTGVKGWCAEGTAVLTNDKMKNGDGNIDTRTLERLCSYLHCQPGDIMEYVEDEE